MIKRSTTDEMLETFQSLDEAGRRRVLEYARSLSGRTPRGTSGNALLDHFGVWSEAVADEIAQAIDEGCERVNLDAW
jgi:hypothetical protein